MNSKQKISVQITISIAIASFIAWAYFGFNILTKFQVLVEKRDELFGNTFKVFEDKFIWGLDLSLLITGISLLAGGILYFIFKEKKQSNN